MERALAGPAVDRNRLQAVAEVAEQAVQSGGHPTAVVAVANREETVWTHVLPGADGASEDSIYLIASITKPITATALMQLVEEGKLLLDVPIVAYLPEFGQIGKETVTARHLLTHTSGMEEEAFWERLHETGATHAEVFEAACGSWLHFQPGERCEYCSLSFTVLGELIARLTGRPYPEYMRERIFAPLGMDSTAFEPVDASRAMPVHNTTGASQIEAFTRMAIPGGGLWSTVGDLVAFGQVFLRGGASHGYRLLGPAALEMMTRYHTAGLHQLYEGRPEPFNYGLGWSKLMPERESGLLGSKRSYGHGGVTGTFLWIDPEWDLVFVYLTNSWGVEGNTAARMLNAVYGSLSLH
ncbi:MAG: beta-lactamase family protein [Chloroflexota bacterium]|nr:beta-lactamase family protein [Chloroflexota bacterium]